MQTFWEIRARMSVGVQSMNDFTLVRARVIYTCVRACAVPAHIRAHMWGVRTRFLSVANIKNTYVPTAYLPTEQLHVIWEYEKKAERKLKK